MLYYTACVCVLACVLACLARLNAAAVSYSFFNNSRQTDYLEIYQTNHCQIFGVGITMAVDGRSQISFSVRRGDIAVATNCCMDVAS